MPSRAPRSDTLEATRWTEVGHGPWPPRKQRQPGIGTLVFDRWGRVLGAEIERIDLSRPVPNAAFDELRRAWLEHHLLVFRDQSLTPAQQAAFCSRFGELATYPFVEATTDHPNVIPIIKDVDQTSNFGGVWHTDGSYMSSPPMATCLYALEVPRRGGDTLYANTAEAFEALSPALQRLVAPIVGVFTPTMVHGRHGPYASVGQRSEAMAKRDNPSLAEQRVHHPIIRTHPETGRRAIFATIYHCERFQGMTREESLPLLGYLHEHATRDAFTQRLRWRPGTLALWDNRCLFHYALNDYQGERRHMRRVTVEGERPF